MIEILKNYLSKVPKFLVSYHVIILSILVLGVLGVTILEARKVGDSLIDVELEQAKVLELQSQNVIFDQSTINEIVKRTRLTASPSLPLDTDVAPTNNPFFYGNTD